MAQWIKTRGDFFKKKIYLKLYCKVCVWEGVGDPNRNCNMLTPHSYGHQRCVFLVHQGCSTGGPRAQLSAECCSLYCILSLTHLISNSIGGPEGLFCWVAAFPTTSWRQLIWLQLTDFLSPSSYINSSIAHSISILMASQAGICHFPASLDWHVWSSSSRNNCHAVQRILSSVASVYECIMGFYLCAISSAKPAYAISSHNCHRNVSLPSGASLWNGMFDRVDGQYITQILRSCQRTKTELEHDGNCDSICN